MAEQRYLRGSQLPAPAVRRMSRGRMQVLGRRGPAPTRMMFLFVTTLLALLLADHWCLLATRVPIRVDISPTSVTVHSDGSSLATAIRVVADAVQFVPASSSLREYQIDGTDNTNNFTEDATDLAALLPTPGYTFEAWMRTNAAYGNWVDVTIRGIGPQGQAHQIAMPPPGIPVALPHGQPIVITANLERPEAPASIEVMSAGQPIATVTFNRNNRSLKLVGAGAQLDQVYFPVQPVPFAAEVLDSLLRVAIWAWMVLAVVLALAMVLVAGRQFVVSAIRTRGAAVIGNAERQVRTWRDSWNGGTPLPRARPSRAGIRWAWAMRQVTWVDRAAVGALVVAFGFALFVALAQYQGKPHILDASAYYFQAKIFASGRLSAPIPSDLPAFQGPFMVAWQGRWFAQYPPATSALLALGMVFGVPWLVEPLLGVAALGGIYLLGRRLFGGPTALLAVVLGALSPFLIYLSASYLSHTVALAFEVYFLLFVLRFIDSSRQRDIVLAGACLGMMFCTRELSAVVCGVVVTAWLSVWYWRRLWRNRVVVIPAVLAGLAAVGIGLALYLGYNFAQTGDPVLLPRALFSPADRYGFGVGIGFYGRHTLAAGFVVLDQLLTSLMIDLFGWPFYLTLAFIPLALLRRDRARRWDWFNLLLAGCLFVAQAGYFYHGIYLGPRYLYDTLPFLLLLTARGITMLPVLADRILGSITAHLNSLLEHAPFNAADTKKNNPPIRTLCGAGRAATSLVVLALVGFNLTFYLPRQIAQHWNFTGLPSNLPVDAEAIYQKQLHHALVLSDNWFVYNYLLWPLNDPQLTGDTLYAYAPGPNDMMRLKQEYPNRALYELTLGADGSVSFIPLAP